MTNIPNRNRRVGYGKAAALWLLFAGASLVAMEHPADAATTATIAVDNTPPAIVFAFEPTVMVHIDGKPVLRDMKSAGVRRVVNTRALLVRAGNLYYLRA
uniref:hypothetical protein n=1 Tax=Sphingopyxis sp. TaxID=1908224 RepID=UPI0035B46EDC